MQSCPPKYQDRLPPLPEKSRLDPLEHDPLDHEEEPDAPAIALAGTYYAKLYTCGKQLQCDRSHRYESVGRPALTGLFGSAEIRLRPVTKTKTAIRTSALPPARSVRLTTTDKS